MKKVFDLTTLTFIEVPEDYIRCSICEKWKPPVEYCRTKSGKQTRTNCESCYMMDFDEMKRLGRTTHKILQSEGVQRILRIEADKKAYYENSIPVEMMIEYLQSLPKNSRLFVGQSGYYAEGKFGFVEFPIFKKSFDDIQYYRIGFSSQEA